MKDYELSIIFHPDLEMNIDAAVEKVKKIITDNGGEITKEQFDGKKHLAYEIAHQSFGLYYFFEVKLPAAAPAKIMSVLNITDEVMRYLLVTVDERKVKALKKQADGAKEESAEA